MVTRLADGSAPDQYDVGALSVEDGTAELLVGTSADERRDGSLPDR